MEGWRDGFRLTTLIISYCRQFNIIISAAFAMWRARTTSDNLPVVGDPAIWVNTDGQTKYSCLYVAMSTCKRRCNDADVLAVYETHVCIGLYVYMYLCMYNVYKHV